ncbi:chromate resistance exported protein [Chthoniobacter flavus Ellin428]|uniref:Chromate resistance exported protein n=2 Tax=Chthoniobacter flavus TaxID=191863 RepID=B4DC87_9BACT|nr:chromate resistance exported protein [Chthoniobacter flavus Ellin428]TCO82606.1 hypothetical protein EV701_14519 [Chthoniobacter flavus]
MTTEKTDWLLFLYSLPTRRSSARVGIWRQLKKCGALAFKTSAYLLPNRPDLLERFQWLAQQVRDAGGEATLASVSDVEGLSREEIMRQFGDARAEDYSALAEELRDLIAAHRKKPGDDVPEELEKLRRRFQELRKIDFFDSPKAHDVEMLFQRASGLNAPPAKAGKVLDAKQYQRRVWLTRPRPEIDRVGSAWLIRKFIDPRAKFVFATEPSAHPEAIPYDMTGVEFTHHGDACTFETLLKRFAIRFPAVQRIGEMIHDTDLEDGKFQRSECVGLDLLFKGWARLNHSDAEILEKGFACFDALYEVLRKGN